MQSGTLAGRVLLDVRNHEPEVVPLFDVRKLHAVIVFIKPADIKQAGNRVTINGFTQSQARVSTLMRNLEASPYLESANLIEIKAVTSPGSRVNEFTLNVSLERPKEEPEKGGKPAPKAAAAK